MIDGILYIRTVRQSNQASLHPSYMINLYTVSIFYDKNTTFYYYCYFFCRYTLLMREYVYEITLVRMVPQFNFKQARFEPRFFSCSFLPPPSMCFKRPA